MLYAFDMGNVVIKGIDVNEKTVKLLGIDAEEFYSDYRHYDFVLMDGTLSVDDYYRHLERVFDIKIKSKPFSDFFNPHFNEPIIEIIKELKKRGNRVICVSNTFAPHWDVIVEKGLDKFFDKCYLSHEMGLTKPSAAYFNAVMKAENVKPQDVFFTDDYKENIDAAQKLGMNTFWYVKGYDDTKLKKVYGLE